MIHCNTVLLVSKFNRGSEAHVRHMFGLGSGACLYRAYSCRRYRPRGVDDLFRTCISTMCLGLDRCKPQSLGNFVHDVAGHGLVVEDWC